MINDNINLQILVKGSKLFYSCKDCCTVLSKESWCGVANLSGDDVAWKGGIQEKDAVDPPPMHITAL